MEVTKRRYEDFKCLPVHMPDVVFLFPVITDFERRNVLHYNITIIPYFFI